MCVLIVLQNAGESVNSLLSCLKATRASLQEPLKVGLNSNSLRPLKVWGLLKRGLTIFPEEINGEGVDK